MMTHGIVTEGLSPSVRALDASLGIERDDDGEVIIPKRDRLPYHAQRFMREPSYDGPAKIWPEDEANAVLIELLEYFGYKLPPPPTGLPGRNDLPTSKVFKLIRLGFDYFCAVAEKRPGRQWSNYQDAQRMLREEYWRGRKEGEAIAMAQYARNVEVSMPPPSAVLEDTSTVYFIASESGPIKIGKANNPEGRLKSLQTGHHERLSILATCEGGGEREREYHRRFAAFRLTGEWFTRCPEIEAEIERLRLPQPSSEGREG